MNRSSLKESWEDKNIKLGSKLEYISLYIMSLDNNKNLNFQFNYILFTQLLYFLCHESTLIIKRWNDETCQYIKYELTDEILNEKDLNNQLKNLNTIRTHLYINQSNNNIKRLLSRIKKKTIDPSETYLKIIEIFKYGLTKMTSIVDSETFQIIFNCVATNIERFDKIVYNKLNSIVIDLDRNQIGE